MGDPGVFYSLGERVAEVQMFKDLKIGYTVMYSRSCNDMVRLKAPTTKTDLECML